MYEFQLFTATRIYIYVTASFLFVTASFLTGKTWQQPHRCYVTFIACHKIYMADVVPIIHERQIITILNLILRSSHKFTDNLYDRSLYI